MKSESILGVCLLSLALAKAFEFARAFNRILSLDIWSGLPIFKRGDGTDFVGFRGTSSSELDISIQSDRDACLLAERGDGEMGRSIPKSSRPDRGEVCVACFFGLFSNIRLSGEVLMPEARMSSNGLRIPRGGSGTSSPSEFIGNGWGGREICNGGWSLALDPDAVGKFDKMLSKLDNNPPGRIVLASLDGWREFSFVFLTRFGFGRGAFVGFGDVCISFSESESTPKNFDRLACPLGLMREVFGWRWA